MKKSNSNIYNSNKFKYKKEKVYSKKIGILKILGLSNLIVGLNMILEKQLKKVDVKSNLFIRKCSIK